LSCHKSLRQDKEKKLSNYEQLIHAKWTREDIDFNTSRSRLMQLLYRYEPHPNISRDDNIFLGDDNYFDLRMYNE